MKDKKPLCADFATIIISAINEVLFKTIDEFNYNKYSF